VRRLAVGLVVLTTAATLVACQPVKPATGPRVMLIGDSVAVSLANQLSVSFEAQRWVFMHKAQAGCGIVRGDIFYLQGGAHPFPCDPNAWNAHEEGLVEFDPAVVISMSIYEIFPREVDGDQTCLAPGEPPLVYEPWTDACDAFLLQLLDEKRQQFTARGATWVILTTPPPTGYPGVDRDAASRTEHLNDLLWQFQAQHPDVGLVDVAAWVCPGGPPCPEYVNGVQVRHDGLHFTDVGGTWVAAGVVATIVAAFS